MDSSNSTTPGSSIPSSEPLSARLRGSPSRADLEDAAALLERCQEHLHIDGAKKVEFLVSPRADSAVVQVDGVERFRVHTTTTGQIGFRYDLAAARSDDKHSYTVPPMQWGSRDG